MMFGNDLQPSIALDENGIVIKKFSEKKSSLSEEIHGSRHQAVHGLNMSNGNHTHTFFMEVLKNKACKSLTLNPKLKGSQKRPFN